MRRDARRSEVRRGCFGYLADWFTWLMLGCQSLDITLSIGYRNSF